MATELEDAAFVKQYEGLVESIAKQTKAQLSIACDTRDLVAYGYTGLLEAKSRFDASKGVPFQVFAYYRVRGAVIDGVRKMAFLPRRAHARLRAAEMADHEAESQGEARAQPQGGGTASADGAQAAKTLDGILGAMAAAYCVTGASQGQEVGADSAPTPEAHVIDQERRQRVLKAVEALPERERHLIVGYYLHDRPLTDVAAEIGLSKSWGSRLQWRGLSLLRRSLQGTAV